MPKPFTISIDVEEAYLGYVMRKLNIMDGVINIDFDFDKPSGALHDDEDDDRPVRNGQGGDRRSAAFKNGRALKRQNDTKRRATPRVPGAIRQIDQIALLVAAKPLTNEELSEQLGGAKKKNGVFNAKRSGLVKRTVRGDWEITPKGAKRVAEIKRLQKSEEA